jgi:hypothetical protein
MIFDTSERKKNRARLIIFDISMKTWVMEVGDLANDLAGTGKTTVISRAAEEALSRQ